MEKYAANANYDDLEHWPFDNPDSNYKILRGNPVASGRLDKLEQSGAYRLGIWRCTEGAFECTELGDELQTIISGRLKISRVGGETQEFGPGDSIFTHRGDRVIWDVEETVTKVFFTYL